MSGFKRPFKSAVAFLLAAAMTFGNVGEYGAVLVHADEIPNHIHTFGISASDNGDGSHTYTCTSEDCDKSEGYQETEACADDNSDGKCDACGASVGTGKQPDNDNPDNDEPNNGETGCKGGSSADYKNHTAAINWYPGYDEEGVHIGECSECGTTVKAECTFDTTYTCDICMLTTPLGGINPLGGPEPHEHKYGNDKTCTVVVGANDDGTKILCGALYESHEHNTSSQPWTPDGKGHHYQQCSVTWGTHGTKTYGRCENGKPTDGNTGTQQNCSYALNTDNGRNICSTCEFEEQNSDTVSIDGTIMWNDTVNGINWKNAIRPSISVDSLKSMQLLRLEGTNKTKTENDQTVADFSGSTVIDLFYDKADTSKNGYCTITELENGEWYYVISKVPMFQYYRITANGEGGEADPGNYSVVYYNADSVNATKPAKIGNLDVVVDIKDSIVLDPIMGKYMVKKQIPQDSSDSTAFTFKVKFAQDPYLVAHSSKLTVDVDEEGNKLTIQNGESKTYEAPKGLYYMVVEDNAAGYVTEYANNNSYNHRTAVSAAAADETTLDNNAPIIYNIPLDQPVSLEKLWNDNNDTAERMGKPTEDAAQAEWLKYLGLYYQLGEIGAAQPSYDNENWVLLYDGKDGAGGVEGELTKLHINGAMSGIIAKKSFNNWTISYKHGDSTKFPSYYVDDAGEVWRIFYQIKEHSIENNGTLLYNAVTNLVDAADPSAGYIVTNTKLTEFKGTIHWKDKAISAHEVEALGRPTSVTLELHRTSSDGTHADEKFKTYTIKEKASKDGFECFDEYNNPVTDIIVTKKTVDEEDCWYFEFRDLELYTSTGSIYVYSVIEQTVTPTGTSPSEHATYVTKYDNGAGPSSQQEKALYYHDDFPSKENPNVNEIINTLYDKTSFSATKNWIDQAGKDARINGKLSATLALFRYPISKNYAQASPAVVTTAEGSKFVTQKLSVDAVENGNYTFNFDDFELPKYDEHGDLYVYYVKEIFDVDGNETKNAGYEKSYDNTSAEYHDFVIGDHAMPAVGAFNRGTIINSNITKEPYTLQMDWLTAAYQNAPANATVYLQVQKKSADGTWSICDVYDANGLRITATNNAGEHMDNTVRLTGFTSSQLSQQKVIYLDRLQEGETYRVVETRVEIKDQDTIIYEAPSSYITGPSFSIGEADYRFQEYSYNSSNSITKTPSMVSTPSSDTVATLYCSNTLYKNIDFLAVKNWSPAPDYSDSDNPPKVTFVLYRKNVDDPYKSTEEETLKTVTFGKGDCTDSDYTDGADKWYYKFSQDSNGKALPFYDELGYKYDYYIKETNCDAEPGDGSTETYKSYRTINSETQETITNYITSGSYASVWVEVNWKDDGDAVSRKKSYVQMTYVIGGKEYTGSEIRNAGKVLSDDGSYYKVKLLDKDGIEHTYKITVTEWDAAFENDNAKNNSIYEVTATTGWLKEIRVPADIKEIKVTDEGKAPTEIDASFQYKFKEVTLNNRPGVTGAYDNNHYDNTNLPSDDALKALVEYYGADSNKDIDLIATNNQVYKVTESDAAINASGTHVITNTRVGLVDHVVYKVWEDGKGLSYLLDYVEGKSDFPAAPPTDPAQGYVNRPYIDLTLRRLGATAGDFDKSYQSVRLRASSDAGGSTTVLTPYKIINGVELGVLEDTSYFAINVIDINTWEYTFKSMPKYDANGVKYEYAFTETTGNTINVPDGNGSQKPEPVIYETNIRERTDSDYVEQTLRTGDISRYGIKNLKTGTVNYRVYIKWLDGQSKERPDVFNKLYYKIEGDDEVYEYGADKDADKAHNVYIGDEIDYVWSESKDADKDKYDYSCCIYGLNQYDKAGNLITYFTNETLSTQGDYKKTTYENRDAANADDPDSSTINKHPYESTYLAPNGGCVTLLREGALVVNGVKLWQNLQVGTKISELDKDSMPIIMLTRTKTVNGEKVVVPFTIVDDQGNTQATPKAIFTRLKDGNTSYEFTPGMTLEEMTVKGKYSKVLLYAVGDGIDTDQITGFAQTAGKLARLDKYDDKGNKYEYVATEVLRGGMLKVYAFADNSFTLTNTFETAPEKNTRSVYVTKNWDFSRLNDIGYIVSDMNNNSYYPEVEFKLYRIEKGKVDGNAWIKPENLIQTKKVNLNTKKVTTTINGVSKTEPLTEAFVEVQSGGVIRNGKNSTGDVINLTLTDDAKALKALEFSDLRIWSESGKQYVYAIVETKINGYETYQYAADVKLADDGSTERTNGDLAGSEIFTYSNICILDDASFIDEEKNRSLEATTIKDYHSTAYFINKYTPDPQLAIVGQKYWKDQASKDLRPTDLALTVSRSFSGESSSKTIAQGDNPDIKVEWELSPVTDPSQWEKDYSNAKSLDWMADSVFSAPEASVWENKTAENGYRGKHYWAYRITNNEGKVMLSKYAPNGTEFVYTITEGEIEGNYYQKSRASVKTSTGTGSEKASDAQEGTTIKLVGQNLVNELNVNYTVKKTWEDGANRYNLRPSGLIVVLQRRARTSATGITPAVYDDWEYIAPWGDETMFPNFDDESIATGDAVKKVNLCKVTINDTSDAAVAIRMPKTYTSQYTFANLPAAKVAVVEGVEVKQPYEYRAVEYAIVGTNKTDGTEQLWTSKYKEGTVTEFLNEKTSDYEHGEVGAYKISAVYTEGKEVNLTNNLISSKLVVTKQWDDNSNQYETRPTNASGSPYIMFYLKYALTAPDAHETPGPTAYKYLTTDGKDYVAGGADNRQVYTLAFAGDSYTYSLDNLPNRDADMNRYWYQVEEVYPTGEETVAGISKLESYVNPNTTEGKIKVVASEQEDGSGKYIYNVTITNTLKILQPTPDVEKSGTVTARKVWVGQDYVDGSWKSVQDEAKDLFGQYPKVKFRLIRYKLVTAEDGSKKYVEDPYLNDKIITLDGEIDDGESAMKESDQWVATWTGLPATDNLGNKYKYFVEEMVPTEEEQAQYAPSAKTRYDYIGITGTLTEKATTTSEAKISDMKSGWIPTAEDNNVDLSADAVWNYDFTISNMHKTSLTVIKNWEDENNAFSTRPDTLKLTLQRRIAESTNDDDFKNVNIDGSVPESEDKATKALLTEEKNAFYENEEDKVPGVQSDKWKYVFNDLPLYCTDEGEHYGKRYEYRAVELLADTKSEDDADSKKLTDVYKVTNGLTAVDQEGSSSATEAIAASIYDNAYAVDSETKVVSATYRTYSQEITNTLKKESKIKVSVIWDDAQNQDGVRPENVTVQLWAKIGDESFPVQSKKDIDPVKYPDDHTVYKRVIAYTPGNDAGNRWPVQEYDDLPLCSMKNGYPQDVYYYFVEDSISEYTINYGQKKVKADGTVDPVEYKTTGVDAAMVLIPTAEGKPIQEISVKNVHTPATVDKTITKEWENLSGVPASLMAEAQPGSINVYLQKRFVRRDEVVEENKYLTNGTEPSYGTKTTALLKFVDKAATISDTAPGTDLTDYIADTNDVTLSGGAGSTVWTATWYKQPVYYNPTGTNEDPGVSYKVEYSVVEKDWRTGKTETVTEDGAEKAIGGFKSKITSDTDNAFTATNTLTKTSLKVTKVWDDQSDAYETRPTKLSFKLQRRIEKDSAGSEQYADVTDKDGKNVILTLTAENAVGGVSDKWQGTFSNLPVMDKDGNIISYRAVEIVKLDSEPDDSSLTLLDAYNCANGLAENGIEITVNYSGAEASSETINASKYVNKEKTVFSYEQTVTNTLRMEGAVKVAKVWDDDNNRDNKRTGTIMSLYRIPVSGESTTPVEVCDSSSKQLKKTLTGSKNDSSATNTGWYGSFGIDSGDMKLPIYTAKNNKMQLIGYQIQETPITKYTTSYSVDNGVSYTELSNSVVVNAVAPTSDTDSSNVKVIKVKNTYTPAVTARKLEKDWNTTGVDSALSGAAKPESITVYLTATYEDSNGSDVEVYVDKAGKIITDADGKPVVRTANNVPESAKVTLSASSEDPVTKKWTYEWKGSSMFIYSNETFKNGDDDGTGYAPGTAQEIVYNAYEVSMNGYSWAVAGVNDASGKQTGYTLTNTMRTTYLDVTKIWVDEKNGYTTRPNSITVTLQQKLDGGNFTDVTLSDGNIATATLSASSKNKAGEQGSQVNVDDPDNVWVGCFDNLPMYDKNGKFIVYRAIEVTTFDNGTDLTIVYTPSNALASENGGAGPAVTTVADGADDSDGSNTPKQHYEQTITNTLKYGNIKVEKLWKDKDDEDGLRPAHLKVILKRNDGVGSKLNATSFTDNQEIVLDKNNAIGGKTNDWGGSFIKLPVGTAAGNVAKLIGYSMDEDSDDADKNLDDYELVKYRVENGVATELDENNDEVTLKAVSNPEDVTNAITYRLTNTLSVVEITVKKVWEDQDNKFHSRPDEITIYLKRKTDNTEWSVIDTKYITKASWADITFKDLHKFTHEGDKYYYMVEEERVNGYTTKMDVVNDPDKGDDLQTVTFTNTLEYVSVSGKVTFTGEENLSAAQIEALRNERKTTESKAYPTEIILYKKVGGTWAEVKAYVNDTIEMTLIPAYPDNQPTDVPDWTYKFENLPKYDKDGNQIIYATKEEFSDYYVQTQPGEATNGYQEGSVNSVNGNVTGADFTNRLQTFSVTGTKTWDDASNRFGTRPDELDIIITYPDAATIAGERVTGTITWVKNATDSGAALDTWTYTVSGLLRKDKEGNDIAYSFREGDHGVEPAEPLTNYNIRNYYNVTENGNDNIVTADSETYNTKYSGITASGTATEAAATTLGLGNCTGITYGTDSNGLVVVSGVDFKNEVMSAAILGIENKTKVETDQTSGKKVSAGGMVGIVTNESPKADKYDKEIEAMDPGTKLSRNPFAVSWKADANWRYRDSFKVLYHESVDAGSEQKEIIVNDFIDENGELKPITDGVYDPLKAVFTDEHIDISKDSATGEIKLILATTPGGMQPATFVNVEFVPTIAIENRTTGRVGGVVQVKDGVAGKDADGILEIDNKPSYVAREVMAKADSGYRINLSKLTVAPLRLPEGDGTQPGATDDPTLTSMLDGLMPLRVYAAEPTVRENITITGDRFTATLPATLAGTSVDVEITGTVAISKEGGNVKGLTLTLDKDTIPLEFGVVFETIPSSGSYEDPEDGNNNGIWKTIVVTPSPIALVGPNGLGPAKTSDSMPVGMLSALGSVFVAAGAALSAVGRRRRKKDTVVVSEADKSAEE